MFLYTSAKRSIADRSRARKLMREPSLPLTERNIEFLNKRDKKKQANDSEEEEYCDSEDEHRKDARDRLFGSREVQVSEWLRELP